MKKFLNNRPLFFIFVAFGLGIYFARPIFSLNLFAIIFCSVLIGAISFLCIKYKLFKRLALIFICVCLGFGSFFLSTRLITGKSYGDDKHIVVGRVCATTVYDNSQSIILDSVVVDGTRESNNFKVQVFDETNIEIGFVISFNAKISNASLYNFGKFNSYYYKYKISNECSVNIGDCSIVKTDSLTFAEKVRLSVKKLLDTNMPTEEASVCFASLFGDKTYIPSDIKEDFSVSGMAHLLAVSGLHVGFVVALLSFILSKIRCKKYIKVGIITIILGFYCYLCSFSSSVVRASIMFFILSLSGLLGKKYDRLNAWSIAGILLLLIRPLYVFDAGFLLSFACVLCLFMFYRTFERLFTKWHFPKRLAQAFAVSVPIQFGLLPLMASFYSKISLLGIFINLFAIPIFEIFFILLFIFAIMCSILPFMSFILKLPMLLLHILILAVAFFANINWAIINLTPQSGMVIISIYIGFFMLSKYVNIKLKSKIISVAIIVFCGLTITLSSNVATVSKSTINVINSYNNYAYILELDGKQFAVGDFESGVFKQARAYVDYSNKGKIDYLISFNGKIPSNNEYFENIYSCNSDNGLMLGESYLLGDINVSVINLSSKFAGVLFQGSKMTVFVCNDITITNSICEEFVSSCPDINLIVGSENMVSKYAQFCDSALLYDGKNLAMPDGNTKKLTGNWTFTIKDDNIKNIRRLD